MQERDVFLFRYSDCKCLVKWVGEAGVGGSSKLHGCGVERCGVPKGRQMR